MGGTAGCWGTLGWAGGWHQQWVLLKALGALRLTTGDTEESTGAVGYGTGSWYLVVLGAWSRGETLQRALMLVVEDAGSTLIDTGVVPSSSE